MSILSKRLKDVREMMNLKQIQVYEKTGINNKTLSGYENGVSEPDTETLTKLADLYNVSVDYLLGRSKTKNPNIDDLYYQDKEQWTDEEIEEARAFIETRRMLKKQKNISNAKDDEQ